MTLGKYTDPAFPTNHASGLPPSPSRENPGQVFPQTSPSEEKISTPPQRSVEQSIGNPFLMSNALQKVDHAFGNVIAILEDEEAAQGGSARENVLLETFRGWRDDLERLRACHGVSENPVITPADRTEPAQEGGMFTD